jgi:hypothetical protein
VEASDQIFLKKKERNQQKKRSNYAFFKKWTEDVNAADLLGKYFVRSAAAVDN